MHRLIHTLASLVVLLHIAGGCCWHHVHPEQSACCAATIPADHDCGHDHHAVCENHQHQPAEHSGQHPEPHQHGCDTGQCVFVVPETGRPLPVTPDSQWQVCQVPEDQRILGTGTASSHAETPLPGGRCPPAAVYLVNQVFLL